MSEKALAQIARALGKTLIHHAKERDPESKKRIAALHTELCAVYRQDKAEQEQQDAEHRTEGSTTTI